MASDQPTVMIQLSRRTIQAMLELKQLLQPHGITISIAGPDAYAQLIQATMGMEDDEIERARDELIAAASVHESQEPLVDRPDRQPVSEQKTGEPAITPPSRPPATPEIDDQTASASDPHDLRSSPAAPAPTRSGPLSQQPRAPEQSLKRPAQSTPPGAIQPRLNIVATSAPVLTCDDCQSEVTVPIGQWNRSAPLDVGCRCGAQYRVATDARRYPRQHVELPGRYTNLEDEQQSGSMVVEDIAFGGIRFRPTTPHTLVPGACLHIQFTLDDWRRTCVWEQVQVRHVQEETLGAVFLELDLVNPGLSDYLHT